jgi:pimeloyl-ACP methyl ester carboxylesterase
VTKGFIAIGLLALAASPARAQQPVRLLDTPCTAAQNAQVTEPKSGRTYLLDYPCDLKAGEKVTFILNLHGGGSSGTWQRRYFPAFEYKDQHRLVVASPYSPTRSWSANDDAYLQNIVSAIIEKLGRANVQAFWLAGHSQGGATSRRLVCTDFFRSKVDGFLSLSGGRLGGAAPRSQGAGRPAQKTETPAATSPAPPAATGAAGAAAAPAGDPTCDFAHIFAIGEHEIASLPATSALATKYGCGARVRRPDVVDSKPGLVHDGGRQNPGTKQWGLLPRPGRAEVFVYPSCSSGRVIADVVRIDKGHTEGLEPLVTEELVKLMLSAKGGKVQQGG